MAKEIINNQQANPAGIQLSATNTQVEFTAGSDYEVHLMGSDTPAVVDQQLQIHRPIVNTSVRLSFQFTSKKGSESGVTDLSLEIPGIYGPRRQAALPVIPEPAQWHAASRGCNTLEEISAIIHTEDAREAAHAFAEELEELTEKILPASPATAAAEHTIFFERRRDLTYLGEEGYQIISGRLGIHVQAPQKVGLLWGGKTILQLLLRNGFPYGDLRDYPRYPVRGFMLDVGRRPVSMDTLHKIVRFMSWFKMNDFQVHLSDNYIWLEDYAQEGDDSTFDAYEAFRLESSIQNRDGDTPTAKDYAYSKAEFRNFIEWSKDQGVRIVPEIDVPAHALSFAKLFPEHTVYGKRSPLCKNRPLTDHLDVSRPETIEFIKRIFDDYTGGSEPVFPPNVTVHVGADEFLSDYTAYRQFFNEIIPYIKKTNPVRAWGGLTWIKDQPETPICPEAVNGVQLNLWSSDWADGLEMYQMGFDLINTIDDYLYMVPNGTGRRGSYTDLLNKERIFKEFSPSRVRIKGGQYAELPAGEKRMLGGAFAMWNDNIDKRATGLSEGELFDRFWDALPLMAEKTWGDCPGRSSVREIDTVAQVWPEILEKTFSGTLKLRPIVCENHHADPTVNILFLLGGESYVKTNEPPFPVGTTLTLDIEFEETAPNQIIMEGDAPYGTYDIRLTESGKLGFTREGYTYEFNYIPPTGQRLHLKIITKPQKTILQIGTFLRKKARGTFTHDGIVRCKKLKSASFSIPCMYLGSRTNAVKARIHRISFHKD